MRKPPLLLLALCLFVSPLFAQKDFTAWKSIDCYPGLEYSQKRSTGNGNKESHELSIKFRHHYEKAIAFSYSIKDSGGKSTLGSGNMSLDAGEDKIIQFNLSDSENLRVNITNFRLGGEGGDLIPCGSDSGDSEKKKDGDDKSDDEDKKEKKKESEVPAIVPAGGVAATALIVGAGDKNEDGRKEGQAKESEDKKSGDQGDKNSQQETSEKKTESGEQTEVKEKETEVGKHEEQGKEGERKEGEEKEGERKEGEGKEGLGKEGEKTGNEGAVKEKEAEVGELKEGEQKEGENKGGEKKEGEEKEHGEEKEEKQVTSPVTPTVETEIKNVQQTQPVTENKEPEKINEVTNPPAEEKKEQPVEKTEEKSKAEETPVVVPTSNEQKTQEQEPVKTEEQPKPIELTPKPEPTVTPTETPVKETKTEASTPVTEPKTKEGPEPVVEEKEEETSEGEAVEEAEEEKTLPEEEKGEEAGEAKEGEGAGETEKEEEEANDDLNRRIEEGKQRQQEADDSRDQMASQLGDILSAEGGTDTYTRLAIGMNLEGGFAVQAVPMVENASSTTGAITPYSASTLPINLGIYARPELWLLRNQYFGLGVDYRVILTYSVLAGGGISSTALASGGNVRFQAGLKHFKLHFQAGKENRNGTYSNDHDVTNTALGSGTNNNIFSDGEYDYQVSNTGFGALIDFKDNNDKEAFIKYTLSYERPDFLPAANAAIKTHTIHVRYFLDIIFTYGNKYPIAGKPLYTYLASDKNKDYFFFGLGKTFKIFKSK